MNRKSTLGWLAVGVCVGAAVGWWGFNGAESVKAGVGMGPSLVRPMTAGDDRHEDFILSTGPVSVGLSGPDLDGVWLLDYRAGKLLGTAVNRQTGKISGWAEVDLVTEFGIPPKQNVHFLMTTGTVARGQAALYLAETTTGKFGVYTMGMGDGPRAAIQIRRHDQVLFRQPPKPAAN